MPKLSGVSPAIALVEHVPRVQAEPGADHQPHRHAVEDEADEELDEAAGHGAGDHAVDEWP